MLNASLTYMLALGVSSVSFMLLVRHKEIKVYRKNIIIRPEPDRRVLLRGLSIDRAPQLRYQ